MIVRRESLNNYCLGATSAFLSTDSSMLNLDSKCGKGTALRRKRIIGGSASLPTHHGWHVNKHKNYRFAYIFIKICL